MNVADTETDRNVTACATFCKLQQQKLSIYLLDHVRNNLHTTNRLIKNLYKHDKNY